MKITYEVHGIFERLSTHDQGVAQTSLTSLVKTIRVVATEQGRYHLSSVHQSFGLDFLPQLTFENLLEQEESSAYVAPLILRPVDETIDVISVEHKYSFQAENLTLNLASDDPQIPNWSGDRCEGIYQLAIDENTTDDYQCSIVQQTLLLLQQVSPLEIIHAALRSPSNFAVSLLLTQGERVRVWQTLDEVSSVIKEAVLALSHNNFDSLSLEAQQLVENYKQKYRIISQYTLPNFHYSVELSSQETFILGKNKHRSVIENIIKSAKQFLAIASFRLEDKEISELIASKVKELPKGVWILTDLGSEVLDRIDTNMEGKIDYEEDYAESDRKKKECLRLLTDAGAFIRSGLFHVKFYLTEQQAYLGSCNLTGGSLERNHEAGIIWKNTIEHQQLFDTFCHFWQHQTKANIMSSPQGINSISLPNRSSLLKSEGFLNHSEYMQDLTNSLKLFARNPQGEILIYTRTFRPTSEQEEILGYLKTRIFYGFRKDSYLSATQIYNLHAKIVIIGTSIAYIGSQDFSTSRSFIHDLTYKITDSKTINHLLESATKMLHH